MKKTSKINLITGFVIIFLVIIDQVIKYFVDLYLQPIGTQTVIPNFLQLHYFENDGAMMGFMSGQTEIMSIAALICLVAVFVVLMSGKVKFGVLYVCIAGIAAGGLGNIIDRVFRGYVIDYIEVLFVDFYIFNFADCLVTVAAFSIIAYEIYEIIQESKLKKANKQNG
ncbi:MAG: signal peptidase II [Clostridia bacterium]